MRANIYTNRHRNYKKQIEVYHDENFMIRVDAMAAGPISLKIFSLAHCVHYEIFEIFDRF